MTEEWNAEDESNELANMFNLSEKDAALVHAYLRLAYAEGVKEGINRSEGVIMKAFRDWEVKKT